VHHTQQSCIIFGTTISKPSLVQRLKDEGIEFLHQIFALFSIDFGGGNQTVTVVISNAGDARRKYSVTDMLRS